MLETPPKNWLKRKTDASVILTGSSYIEMVCRDNKRTIVTSQTQTIGDAPVLMRKAITIRKSFNHSKTI